MNISIGQLIFSAVLSIGLWSCAETSKNVSISTEEADTTYCIETALRSKIGTHAVRKEPVLETLTLPGKISYNENDRVSFNSLLEGVVEDVGFEAGDQVRKGQVLATIRSTAANDLYEQQQLVDKKIAFLEGQVRSKTELLANGLIAEPELLETKHELENAIIEQARIQQSLQFYRIIGNGRYQLLAPKNGYIIQKSISSGQILSVDSEPLFSISNLKEVWIMVNIYASNMRFVHEGDSVLVHTVAFPDEELKGKIDRIFPIFDEQEHVLKARVVLANNDLKYVPGLSADIIVNQTMNQRASYAIPNEAVILQENQLYVVEYRGDCDMAIKKINAVARNESTTYVDDTFGEDVSVITSNALLIFEQLNRR